MLGLIAAGFAASGMLMMHASRVSRFEIRDRILDALQLAGDFALTHRGRSFDHGTVRGNDIVGFDQHDIAAAQGARFDQAVLAPIGAE